MHPKRLADYPVFSRKTTIILRQLENTLAYLPASPVAIAIIVKIYITYNRTVPNFHAVNQNSSWPGHASFHSYWWKTLLFYQVTRSHRSGYFLIITLPSIIINRINNYLPFLYNNIAVDFEQVMWITSKNALRQDYKITFSYLYYYVRSVWDFQVQPKTVGVVRKF